MKTRERAIKVLRDIGLSGVHRRLHEHFYGWGFDRGSLKGFLINLPLPYAAVLFVCLRPLVGSPLVTPTSTQELRVIRPGSV